MNQAQHSKQINTIDILIGTGVAGGIETVIKKVSRHFHAKGYRVRVVQLMWAGVCWMDHPDTDEAYFIFDHIFEPDIDTFALGYSEFIKSYGAPDIVFATNWPILTMVCKKALLLQNCTDTKIIAWPHTEIFQYVNNQYGGLEYLALADGVIAISQNIYRALNSVIPSDKLYQISNPVMIPSDPFQHDTLHHNLLFVGRLSPEKRLDIIFEALTMLPDWNLKIIGDGTIKDDLLALADELHITEQLEWLGWQNDPWEFCDNIDLQIIASVYEGFPMNAIEGLAYGIPLISTPVGGVIDYIKAGENGYLYNHGSAEELATTIKYIESGELPFPSTEACVSTAMIYAEDKVYQLFEECIHTI